MNTLMTKSMRLNLFKVTDNGFRQYILLLDIYKDESTMKSGGEVLKSIQIMTK